MLSHATIIKPLFDIMSRDTQEFGKLGGTNEVANKRVTNLTQVNWKAQKHLFTYNILNCIMKKKTPRII